LKGLSPAEKLTQRGPICFELEESRGEPIQRANFRARVSAIAGNPYRDSH